MTAGNLAISQSLISIVRERIEEKDSESIYTAPNMFEAARQVGDGLREVYRRDAEALKDHHIEYNSQIIFGGQIGNELPRLFCVYAPGNFIEATPDTPYFQIGETKYGKPIIDRVITPATTLDEAAKCALISMDSTLRSNISVGLPLDLLLYQEGALQVTKFVQIDHDNQYMGMIRNTWGARLKQVFNDIPDPTWRDAPSTPGRPRLETDPTFPVRAPLPAGLDSEPRELPVQLVAQGRPRTPPS